MNNFTDVTRTLATMVHNLLMRNHMVIPPGVVCHLIDRYMARKMMSQAANREAEV